MTQEIKIRAYTIHANLRLVLTQKVYFEPEKLFNEM